MKNFARYLKAPSKEPSRLNAIVFYDCESYVPKMLKSKNAEEAKEFLNQLENNTLENETYLICAKFDINNELIERVYQNVSEKSFGFYQDIKSKFWNDVVFVNQNHKDIYVYAHYHLADFLMSDGFNRIVENGYEIESFSYKNPFFFTFCRKIPQYNKNGTPKMRKGKQVNECYRIYLRDSFSIFAKGLSKIGKEMGLHKGDFTAHDVKPTQKDLKLRIEYCLQDVNITRKAIRQFENFCLENNLGSLQLTTASQAMVAYRTRFMKNDSIEIHEKDTAIMIERESYFGGRTEVFKMGEFEDLYYIDVNSMYPHVMRKEKYPTKLLKTKYLTYQTEEDKKEAIEEFKDCIQEGYLLHAIVKLESHLPIYPKKAKIGTIFPVGEFYTGLSTPEIKIAIERNEIKDILFYSVYESNYLFNDYVTWFYKKRIEYKEAEKTALEGICKIFLNSLYGKFAQMEIETTEIEDRDYGKGYFGTDTIIDDEGNMLYLQILDGKPYHSIKKGNAYNSFVAISAHVTSYARMLLWDCIIKSGVENVYYMDTDSLFLSETGYKNIESEGLLHNSELGKFKLEHKITKAIFRGCKDYYIEYYDKGELKSETKIKGISLKNAVQISENEFIMSRPLTISDGLKSGNIGKHGTMYLKKTLKREYRKGTVMDKQVIPLELNEDLKTFENERFKRKNK